MRFLSMQKQEECALSIQLSMIPIEVRGSISNVNFKSAIIRGACAKKMIEQSERNSANEDF